jgi:hypothetical protein
VSAKYKTKNIKTDVKEVFLATINQRSANTSSIINFRLIATRLCRVWLSGSLACPFKKIRIVTSEITEKTGDNIKISPKQRFILNIETIKQAVNRNSIFNNTSNKMYL